jgi:hypothetical protein
MSEFESEQENYNSNLENSIVLSRTIDEDSLFGYSSDLNSSDDEEE